MLFGHIWQGHEVSTFDIKSPHMRLFVGDRWVNVGTVKTDTKGFVIEVSTDFNEVIHEAAYRDDGTLEWFEWGSQVN